jgi:hypothetical protein
MRMQKMRTVRRAAMTVSLAGVCMCFANERRAQIDILESRVAEDTSGTNVSEVKLNIGVTPKSTSAAVRTEIALLNTSKGMEPPKIYSNSAHTLVGFNASPGRASYNVNLIWLTDDGAYFVDQNLNSRLAILLKGNGFTKAFNEDGVYLSDIREQTLYFEFRSDNAHEFFTFAVNVSNDGQLHLVPNSISTKPYPK